MFLPALPAFFTVDVLDPLAGRPGFARTVVDSTGLVGGFSSLAIGIDGLGVVSYRDFNGYQLKLGHCSNAACSSGTFTRVESAGCFGGYSAITLGVDGMPLGSYLEGINTDLKVAHASSVFGVAFHRRR